MLLRTWKRLHYWIYTCPDSRRGASANFKFEISDARKIAKTLSAFANTEGGRLLIGVKDNGKIAGVHSDEEQYMIEAAARELYCHPEVNFHTDLSSEGRTILVVKIDRSGQKPSLQKWSRTCRLLFASKCSYSMYSPVSLRVWKQKGNSKGELIEYTEREQLLLDLLKENGRLSLSRYYRLSHLSRHAAEHLLAQFIRYDIVEPVFEGHKFLFKLK